MKRFTLFILLLFALIKLGYSQIEPISTNFGAPYYDATYNGALYFPNSDGLRKLDASGKTSTLIKTIPFIHRLFVSGGSLYITTFNGVNEAQLWKSDGTNAGTSMIKSISTDYYIDEFKPGIPYFYFTSITAVWKSDGTSAGTNILVDGFQGQPFKAPGGPDIFKANNTLFVKDVGNFYKWNDLSKSLELLRTNFFIAEMTFELNNFILFNSDNHVDGQHLWRINEDGSFEDLGKTGNVQEYYSDFYTYGNVPTSFNNVVYFLLESTTQLWRSDGTIEGTYTVRVANPGESFSFLANRNNELNYVMYNSNAESSLSVTLWKSNGLKNNNTKLVNLPQKYISELTVVNDRFYFIIDLRDLWHTDGTQSGTFLVKAYPDEIPTTNGGYPRTYHTTSGLLSFNNYLYYSVGSEFHPVYDDSYDSFINYRIPFDLGPIVYITSPLNDQSFTGPTSITLKADAFEYKGSISKVEFYKGNTKLGEDLTAPYSFTWNNIPTGAYKLLAKAYGTKGRVATSDTVNILVTACSATGTISRDFWANVPGAEVYKIPVNTTPTSTTTLTQFEGPVNAADHYGSRIRGYVCPPATGAYTFWIAADDQCELWLSTNDNPANKVKIAYHTGWNYYQEWNKYPTQKSAPINLIAGKKYYIEALQKEHELDDFVSVAWQIQGGLFEGPIPGIRLAPFVITNQSPVVSLTSPGNNSTFTAPTSFTISANASDSDGSITKVEFYQGATKLGEDINSPYNFSWTNVPTGTYYLTAVAYDNSGNKTVSTYFTVTVNPSNGTPMASLTSPVNNSNFTAPATITINATASDPGGAVTKVEFYQGSTLIGTDISSPYSINWTNVAVGTYYITAVAYDNSGLKGTSTYITINVQSSGTCTASGTILREYWNGVSGSTVSTIPVNLPPTSTSQVSLFEGPSNVGTNYGARYRGYICVPTTGNYIFWISSNDESELWLSTNDNPVNKVKIASVTGYTAIRQWDKYASQKSVAINLIAEQRYYVEALHKQGAGTDNLAVGWQLPNGTQERPIPGNRLSPYTSSATLAKAESMKLINENDTSTPVDVILYPNPTPRGTITLAIEGYEQTKQKVYINIVNQSGAVIYSDKVSCDITCRRTIINIDEKFQTGTYIVNVTIDKKVYSQRLMVE